MRQTLFALLLIFAAFSGGALVNGPGLEWIREHAASLSQSLPGNRIEQVDDDLEEFGEEQQGPSGSPDAEQVASQALDPRTRRPSAPLPVATSSPFSDALATAETEDSPGEEFAPPDGPDPDDAFPVRAPRGPSITSPASPAQTTPPARLAEASPALPSPPISLLESAKLRLSDRKIAESGDETPGAADPDTPSAPSAGVGTPEILWADSSTPAVDTPLESPARPGTDSSLRLASNTSPVEDPADSLEWAEVRRRMEELGVGRYWIEGEFGGPVLFRCVVPVIGDRAVSQHFEAEGNDLLSAARVTLRRIALWRATEDTP